MRRAKRGEVWHINGHGRTCGSEQHSDRPAVIVSNDKNNKNSGTVEIVYITTQWKRGLPTHCTIRATGRENTVLCEQIHTVAVERLERYIGKCTKKRNEADRNVHKTFASARRRRKRRCMNLQNGLLKLWGLCCGLQSPRLRGF